MVKIRKFKQSDAEECCKIEIETSVKLFSRIYSPEQRWSFLKYSVPSFFKKDSKKKNRYILIAEERGKVVGFVRFKALEFHRFQTVVNT